MIKKTGTNGIMQVQADNQRADTEKLIALVDYISMMEDIEIPTDEEAENE